MAQMHSQFVTGENEHTSVSVTYESVTGAWGVTLVAINTAKNAVIYQTTFGAFLDEDGAYGLYAKMANALEYRGCPEVRS
jgi:hypothetical protein